MKIEFAEEIDLALRRARSGPVKRRLFKAGETHLVEFLAEDLYAETIDFEFHNGQKAIGVPRFAVAVVCQGHAKKHWEDGVVARKRAVRL